MTYIDSNLVFAASGTTAYANSGSDAVSTNVLDLAPLFASGVIAGGDFGLGEEAHVITAINTAITGTAGFGWQPVLQTDNNPAFNTDLVTEFPLCAPLLNGSVASGNWALSGTNSTTLTVSTAMAAGSIQVGSQLSATGLNGTITVLAQVSGTPGGVGVYTVTPSANTTQAQTLTASTTYAGRQIGMRLPTSGLKRYLRLVWRASLQNSTAGTAQAYITKDPENQQFGSIGFSVG